MLKCLWHGSSYVFTTGTDPKPEEPFAVLGLIAFAVFVASLWLFYLFVLKFDSPIKTISVSAMLSLVVVVLYFLAVYCFFGVT